MSILARGWLIDVYNPTDQSDTNIAVASAEPINADAARTIAEARYRKDNGLPTNHTLFVHAIAPARVGTTITAPRCQTMFNVFGFTVGCTNTARHDGLCGRCFHQRKHSMVTA